MKTSDFDFTLPEELIAQTPADRRDASRLLVYDRASRSVEHRVFSDILEYLKAGDALVVNETRVLPARLRGAREGGGEAELLLLRPLPGGQWEVLARPGRRLKPGARAVFGGGALIAEITDVTEDGGRVAAFTHDEPFDALLERIGEMPLPPYITRKPDDPGRYQTVYARREGSIAAPTAGLHFTPALLEGARAKGVDVVPIVLHVGIGTFRPVKAEDVSEHVMHSERYEVSGEAAARINAARAKGGRVIAVGTTSVRTLESCADEAGIIREGAGETSIFITPGYRFKAVDALVTNFHLPRSTLLMLVSAFMGREEALSAYALAVNERYRFFSFGDAMLIV